jgi:hypothetical protein
MSLSALNIDRRDAIAVLEVLDMYLNSDEAPGDGVKRYYCVLFETVRRGKDVPQACRETYARLATEEAAELERMDT